MNIPTGNSSQLFSAGVSRLLIVIVIAALAAVAGLALLVNIIERKQEARNPFFRVVELTDDTADPAVWGKNFPLQYDSYRRTVDQVRTRYGGSEARAAGSPADRIARAQGFQRKARFHLDFVEAENSMGFHAPQESARILGESINFCRLGQAALTGK